MKLDLSNPYDKQKAQTRFKTLLDKECKIELKEIKRTRTLRSNSYLHAILSLYAIEFGEKLEFVKQVVFKKQANKEIFLVEFTDSETRESYTYLRSSADLDQGEFNTSIERFRNLSAERGLYIPTGDEYLMHRFQIDREIERNKLYL